MYEIVDEKQGIEPICRLIAFQMTALKVNSRTIACNITKLSNDCFKNQGLKSTLLNDHFENEQRTRHRRIIVVENDYRCPTR
jgi:hypothetical protein